MIKVGITGNMGSGKTTVCLIFKMLGIPIYNSDVRAKELMLKPHIKDKIVTLLGEAAYDEAGQLNRTYISQQVFGKPLLLTQLNAIVHPEVRNDVVQWASEKADAPYVLIESALIFENSKQAQYDKIIVVSAPYEMRKARVRARNKWTDQEIEDRLKHQMDETKQLSQADFVIRNNGSESLILQVLTIHRQLMSDLELTF